MTMQPVFPFEPVSTETIPEGANWIGQIKWDGVRILTYFDGHSLKFYNRKKNDRSAHFPELHRFSTYCQAESIILDGEVIALGEDGKPSFHEVMRRDGIRRLERIPIVQKHVPITYMVFDVLFYNGQWLTDWTLEDRLNVLNDVIQSTPSVQVVPSQSRDSIEALASVIEQNGMEGIVIKDLNSTYLLDGKDRRWQKKKFYKDLIAVVGGVTLKDGLVNALLLGQYDSNGDLWYIGHVGTGRLTRQNWRDLTEQIKPLILNERPFANVPTRLKEAVWVLPQLTVKIKYAEWTEGRSLRQPSIEALVDIPPEDCVR